MTKADKDLFTRTYEATLENGETLTVLGPNGVEACREHNKTCTGGQRATKFRLPGLRNAWVWVPE